MRSRFLRLETCILALPVLVAVALMSHLATPEAPEVELAGYATGLRERTASQQHNAARAASAINRAVIEPGAEFSFNKTVKSWWRWSLPDIHYAVQCRAPCGITDY